MIDCGAQLQHDLLRITQLGLFNKASTLPDIKHFLEPNNELEPIQNISNFEEIISKLLFNR